MVLLPRLAHARTEGFFLQSFRRMLKIFHGVCRWNEDDYLFLVGFFRSNIQIMNFNSTLNINISNKTIFHVRKCYFLGQPAVCFTRHQNTSPTATASYVIANSRKKKRASRQFSNRRLNTWCSACGMRFSIIWQFATGRKKGTFRATSRSHGVAPIWATVPESEFSRCWKPQKVVTVRSLVAMNRSP